MNPALAVEQKRLRDIVDRWFEAESHRDLDGTMQFIAKDAVFQPPNASQLEGEQAIRAFFTAFFPSLIAVRGDTHKIVVSASGDMAWGVGPNMMALQGANGRIEICGKWFIAWAKRDGEWKAVAASFSADSSPDGI